jgi:hypothetical protein
MMIIFPIHFLQTTVAFVEIFANLKRNEHEARPSQ